MIPLNQNLNSLFLGSQPSLSPFSVGQTGMQRGHRLIRKVISDTSFQLRREIDFGHLI